MRNELGFKKQQLLDNMDAMKKLYEQNDLTIMAVMNHKIGELIEEIVRIEDNLRTCPDARQSSTSSGLGSAKSETGEYGAKSCEELRTLLLQMVQKTTVLKRRDGSLFSPLSMGEKNELQEAEQAFKDVRSAINARCTREESVPSRSHREHDKRRPHPRGF